MSLARMPTHFVASEFHLIHTYIYMYIYVSM